MTAAEVARAVAGSLRGSGDLVLVGAEVDSRRVRSGDLFVALAGARRDGHEFVAAALEVAGAALVRGDAELPPPPPGRALVAVEDPLAAYHELARQERSARRWRVAAITGSVGKTTTKDFLAALLAPHRPTGASRANRNSTLGLPAELLSQGPEIEVFVAEAGMSRSGELDTLGEILRPDLVLYTRIAPAHIEFFEGLEGVVRAKAELLRWLDGNGTLVVNDDDPNQRGFAAATAAATLHYGSVSAEARVADVLDRGLLGSRFRLVLPDGEAPVELAVAGLHQVENLLAAAAAASALGIAIDDIASTVSTLRAPEHRGRVLQVGDVTVVDDSYNSSPLAVRRLLELLARAPGRRVAVLGEMYELGELAVEAHRQAGCHAAAACDLLVAVGGEHARALCEAAHDHGMPRVRALQVEDADRAAEVLKAVVEPGDVVLVKGSRGVGLDRTVAALGGGG